MPGRGWKSTACWRYRIGAALLQFLHCGVVVVIRFSYLFEEKKLSEVFEDRGKLHKITISLYTQCLYTEWNKNVFSWRRKAVVDRSNFNCVGSVFHARGAATEKAVSPIRRRVCGTSDDEVARRRTTHCRSSWHVGD